MFKQLINLLQKRTVHQINLIVIGVLECVVIGWFFDVDKVVEQVNLNTEKFKIPAIWLKVSIRFIAPILLSVLFIWNMYNLFVVNKGNYGGYPIWAICIAGWLVSILVFVSGFIIKVIVNAKKKNGFVENEIEWK